MNFALNETRERKKYRLENGYLSTRPKQAWLEMLKYKRDKIS